MFSFSTKIHSFLANYYIQRIVLVLTIFLKLLRFFNLQNYSKRNVISIDGRWAQLIHKITYTCLLIKYLDTGYYTFVELHNYKFERLTFPSTCKQELLVYNILSDGRLIKAEYEQLELIEEEKRSPDLRKYIIVFGTYIKK